MQKFIFFLIYGWLFPYRNDAIACYSCHDIKEKCFDPWNYDQFPKQTCPSRCFMCYVATGVFTETIETVNKTKPGYGSIYGCYCGEEKGYGCHNVKGPFGPIRYCKSGASDFQYKHFKYW